MKIEVMGAGCKTCKVLYENTKQAIIDLELDVEVEYVTDLSKIISMGFMKTPILSVNGKAIVVGSMPSVDEIKKILKETK